MTRLYTTIPHHEYYAVQHHINNQSKQLHQDTNCDKPVLNDTVIALLLAQKQPNTSPKRSLTSALAQTTTNQPTQALALHFAQSLAQHNHWLKTSLASLALLAQNITITNTSAITNPSSSSKASLLENHRLFATID